MVENKVAKCGMINLLRCKPYHFVRTGTLCEECSKQQCTGEEEQIMKENITKVG